MMLGTDSWRLALSRFDPLVDLALWVRAAAGIEPAPERLVPGPLDADDVPAPQRRSAEADLGPQWSDWWHAVLLAPHTVRGGDFPGADGLEHAPPLREFVAARWPEGHEWHLARQRRFSAVGPRGDLTATEVVRDFEARTGRRARPFHAEVVLAPVRDDVIRRIDGERYLVPERVHDSRRWRVWLAGLVERLG